MAGGVAAGGAGMGEGVGPEGGETEEGGGVGEGAEGV